MANEITELPRRDRTWDMDVREDLEQVCFFNKIDEIKWQSNTGQSVLKSKGVYWTDGISFSLIYAKNLSKHNLPGTSFCVQNRHVRFMQVKVLGLCFKFGLYRIFFLFRVQFRHVSLYIQDISIWLQYTMYASKIKWTANVFYLCCVNRGYRAS